MRCFWTLCIKRSSLRSHLPFIQSVLELRGEVMNKTVEIVRESRTDQKMSEENGRRSMRSGCKLKGNQFFREIVMFFRKCHSFLFLINSFNFDGKMVRNVGDFLPINIRSLTKHTFGCNSPIIANRGSSPVTLKKIQFISNFWGFLRLCGIGF